VATIADANAGDTLLPSETCVQDSGSPGASGQGCSVAGPVERRYTLTPPVGNGGTFTFWLRAPGVGNVGILDVTPTVPAWLQFNWRGAGNTAPTARVGFGVYQGDRRAIHEREVY
jgi:MSHA biogenesis protein MshQ